MSYPYNHAKRAAMVQAFAEWIKRNPGPAEELFSDPESYMHEIEIMEVNLSECRREMSNADIEWSEYMVGAEEQRRNMVRDIERRFSVAEAAE